MSFETPKTYISGHEWSPFGNQIYGLDGRSRGYVPYRERASVVRSRIYNAYMIDDIGFILMEKIPGVDLEASRINLNQNTSRILE